MDIVAIIIITVCGRPEAIVDLVNARYIEPETFTVERYMEFTDRLREEEIPFMARDLGKNCGEDND